MAFTWSNLTDEVSAVILSTWTDVNQILHIQQAERKSWEGITLPFAAFNLKAGDEGSWGVVNIAIERDLEIHYIRKWADTAPAAISDKLEALKSALLAAAYATSKATLLEVAMDDGPDHPVNGIALAKNVALIGGCLRCRFVAGETAL